MTKLKYAACLAVLLLAAPLCALNISYINHDVKNKTAAVGFCMVFEIQNISLQETPFGAVLVMPKDLGGYNNINIISKELDEQIKKLWNVKFEAIACKAPPHYLVTQKKKIENKNTILANVTIDNRLEITVFISKHKKAGKDIYRLKLPQDFKFREEQYKEDFRRYIIEEAKDLL